MRKLIIKCLKDLGFTNIIEAADGAAADDQLDHHPRRQARAAGREGHLLPERNVDPPRRQLGRERAAADHRDEGQGRGWPDAEQAGDDRRAAKLHLRLLQEPGARARGGDRGR